MSTPRIATPCPDWCTLEPLHSVDSVDPERGPLRSHGDVHFGPYLSGFADEYTSAPGTLNLGINVGEIDGNAFRTPQSLRDFALNALEAADWLETVQQQ